MPIEAPESKISISAFISKLISDNRGRWFISAYITLYFLSPLANKFIEAVSNKELLKYIIVFYIFSTVFGYFMLSQEFNTGLSAISLLGLYILGAWLRKSDLKIVHWDKWYDMAGFVICTLILTFGSALLMMLGVHKSIFGYLNPIVIIESMFLFQFFRKLQLGHISWINYLASSAFAAFLLHCHSVLGSRWSIATRMIHQSDFSFVYAISFILGTFIVAVLLDKVRIFAWNTVQKAYCYVKSRFTTETH